MDNETTRPIVEMLLAHIEDRRSWQTQAATVPVSTYVDQAHLARERSVLFEATPQAVALTPDLPEPGSHLTLDSLPAPVVLTRDNDGLVHALANVCLHRGSQVVADGRGCTRRLTCPYHAWSYELGGQLAAVPDGDAFPDVESGSIGLQNLPVLEEHGVIWLNPDHNAGTPSPDLGGIADDFAAFDIAGHRHWRNYRFDLPLNWKLVIDTFLEGYHFASLHRNTVGPLFVANLCHAQQFGRHLREVLPRRSIEELRHQPPDTWDVVPHSAIVYVLFPNTVFVMQIDHIETWRVTPTGNDPGRSRCDLDFYIPDGALTDSASEHWEKNWKLTIDTVIQEDFAAMAGVQRGLASGVLDEVNVGANEPALGFFHAALAESLAP